MENKRLLEYALPLALFFLVLFGPAWTVTAYPGDAVAIFGVTCYDVGKAALEGLDGVKSVTKGWRGFMEINTVVYDPSMITVERMEEALSKAGTYRKTFREGG